MADEVGSFKKWAAEVEKSEVDVNGGGMDQWTVSAWVNNMTLKQGVIIHALNVRLECLKLAMGMQRNWTPEALIRHANDLADFALEGKVPEETKIVGLK